MNAGNYGAVGSSGGGWNQSVPGVAGTSYTLVVDSATENFASPSGEIRLIYLDGTTELRRDVLHVADNAPNKPWDTYTLTTVAPASTNTVKVELATWGEVGTVLFDNAVLTETASVPEPASVVSLGAVATGLALGRRRRAH